MVIHADNTMIQVFLANVFKNSLAKSKDWFVGWVLLNLLLENF